MRDPDERLSVSGIILTGARRTRVPGPFEPILQAARHRVRGGSRSLYVYGSVATGAAEAGSSDVDLLTVGVPTSEAAAIGRELSEEFVDVCRAVEVAIADPSDYVGDSDEAYGNRVFLRHYCVHLTGPDGRASLPDFPGDARAARGFNGDLARHAQRWRLALDRGDDPAVLGRRIARKTLLALAGLVSIHDSCWTTDRATAAQRWPQIEPSTAGDVVVLLQWAEAEVVPTATAIGAALDGIVSATTASFATNIGLWS
jgi:uncharacterized protein